MAGADLINLRPNLRNLIRPNLPNLPHPRLDAHARRGKCQVQDYSILLIYLSKIFRSESNLM